MSKFSYDAARAGVVPQLGDCAMSSRRSSANRPQGWSSASFDTNEDIVVLGGNTNSESLIKPDRQPVNPPTEDLVEKNTGFARFLKKHSSPTHNRVTTGGRIVPMEKRVSPPRFDLAASACSTGQAEAYNKQKMGSASHSIGNYQQETQHHRNGGLPTTETLKQDSDTEATSNSTIINAGISAIVSIAQQTEHAMSNAAMSPQGLCNNLLSAYLPQTQRQNALNCYGAQIPYLPAQSPMAYPGYAWPYTHGCGMAMLTAATGPQIQMAFSENQILVDAEALFDNLDRQLKLIDRHRAMNSHDPNLSSQRMAIVQQRAEAKETIHRLKAQLQSRQGQAHFQGPISFPAAVSSSIAPATMILAQETTSSLGAPSEITIKAQTAVAGSQSSTKRKPIPIVPPPPSSLNQAEPCKKNNASPVRKHSVKPEELCQTDKSEGAERCQEDGRPQSFSNNASATLQVGTADQSVQSKTGEASTTSQAKSSKAQKAPTTNFQSEWMKIQTGEPPAKVGTIYELQLDAMRLPDSVHALIPLSDGTLVHVPGSKLGRPSALLMSEFEKEYWERKPRYTMEMLQNLKARATIKDEGKALSDEYLVTNADGPPISPIKETSSGKGRNQARVQKYVEDQSKRLLDYAPLSHVSTKSELSVAYDAVGRGIPVASAGLAMPDAATGPRIEDALRSDTESMLFEEMSQKGYSSVSIQNINVEVQLPPPGFDGTTDTSQRSAVSSLTAAGRQRSPRLLHRSAPNGGA